MNEYNIIVACDKNNGIGKNNTLPWYNKEDLSYFYKTTKGNNCIIMGRKKPGIVYLKNPYLEEII